MRISRWPSSIEFQFCGAFYKTHDILVALHRRVRWAQVSMINRVAWHCHINQAISQEQIKFLRCRSSNLFQFCRASYKTHGILVALPRRVIWAQFSSAVPNFLLQLVCSWHYILRFQIERFSIRASSHCVFIEVNYEKPRPIRKKWSFICLDLIRTDTDRRSLSLP